MSNSAITFGPSSITSNQIIWSEQVAFRNKIINGNFDIWQRGTSFSVTADGTYTADRWSRAFDGSGATRTVSRQNFAINQTQVPGAPKYFINSTQSVAGTGATYNALIQRIESVRTFAGQTVTVSFWAKSSSASFVQLSFGQRASTSVFTNITSANLTSTWTKYTGTMTLPAIASGVTESGDDFLELAFNFMSNGTHNIDIAQVQLEAGSIATPFEHRPIGTELQLCQRYCQVSPAGNPLYREFNFASSLAVVYMNIMYPVQMRKVPAVSGTYDINDGALQSFVSGSMTGHTNGFIFQQAIPGNAFLDLRSYQADAEL
jgi:hypothetical protein